MNARLGRRIFSRGPNDDNLLNRVVTISWQLSSGQGSSQPPISESAQIKIWPVPVVLVHGIWSSRDAWDHFTPFINNPRFVIFRANYNVNQGGITAALPLTYPNIANATNSSLGFVPNAPIVLASIEQAINDYRNTKNATATQADVIAHSMGGILHD